MKIRIDQRTIMFIVLLIIIGPLRAMLNGQSAAAWIVNKLYILPGIIVGISLHEFAHAKAADLCGDPTPKYTGRLTMDPKAHIDPTGIMCLILCGFGWGRPVIVNPQNFKSKRLNSIFVGLAGVIMNFCLAVVFGFIIKLISLVNLEFLFNPYSFGGIVGEILLQAVIINISLMLFNLIPCPPLDGFGVISDIFNLRGKPIFIFVYRYSFLILLFIVAAGIPSMLLSTPLFRIVDFVMTTICRFPLWYYL